MDLGCSCTDRGSSEGNTSYTVCCAGNPADENGTVSRLQFWAATNITDIETGSLTADGAPGATRTLTCDAGYHCDGAGLDPAAGSCVSYTSGGGDFTAYSADSGDYMGWAWSSGTLERDNSGGSGYWYKSGDYITDAGSGSFAWAADRDVSVYGDDQGGGAAADGAQVIRVNITRLWKLFPAALLLGGVLNNPDLDRRGVVNPLNWIRKKKAT